MNNRNYLLLVLCFTTIVGNSKEYNFNRWNSDFTMQVREYFSNKDYNLEEYIFTTTAKGDGLRGKPAFVNTYPATKISEWGEEKLQVEPLQDSISYNRNGLRLSFEYFSKESKSYGDIIKYYYTGERLDSAIISKVDHNEGPNGSNKFYPEELYRIHWIAPDSAVVNLYNDFDRWRNKWCDKPEMQWRYSFNPTFNIMTFFKHINSQPIVNSFQIKGNHLLTKKTDDYDYHVTFGKQNIITNENGQVIEVNNNDYVKECISQRKRYPEMYKTTYKYNERGDIEEIISETSRFNGGQYNVTKIETTRYKYNYDDQGNWIYRLHQTKIEDPEYLIKDKRIKYTEPIYTIRKILYYDTPEYDELIARNKEIENNRIYTTVDSKAEFPGGQEAETEWKYNALYLLDTPGNNRTYRVEAIVEKDGSLSNFSVDELRTEDYIKEELLRVVKLMPKFTPAHFNGEPVRSKISLVFPLYNILTYQEDKRKKEEDQRIRQAIMEEYEQQKQKDEKNLKKSKKKEKQRQIPINSVIPI